MLSGGNDSRVILSNAETGAAIREFANNPGKVLQVGMNADASIVATVNDSGIAQFWKAADGALIGQLAGHVGAVHGLSFHPTDAEVATSGLDGTVRRWKIPGPPKPLAGHSNPLAAVLLSADGKSAFTASADKSVKQWSLADGKVIREWKALPQPPQKLAVPADSKQIAVGDVTGLITIVPTPEEGAKVAAVPISIGAHTGGISGLAYHPKEKVLVSTGIDGLLKYWSLPIVPDKTLAGNAQPVQRLAVTSDGKQIITGAADAALLVYDGVTGEQAKKLAGHIGTVNALRLNADNSVLASGNATGELRFWNAKDWSPLAAIQGHAGIVHAIAFHPKEPRVATSGIDGTIREWRLPEAPQVLGDENQPGSLVALSGDGKIGVLAGAAKVEGKGVDAVVWNFETKAAAATFKGHDKPVQAVAIAKDGKRAATGDASGRLAVWNPASGAVEGSVVAHDAAITGVAFHPANPQMATSSADGTIKLWQLPIASGTQLAKVDGVITAFASSTDGKQVLFALDDKSVRLFNGDGVRLLAADLPGVVKSLAMSADNKLAVVGTDSGILTTIDLVKGTVVAHVGAHPGSVNGLAVHPQSNQIASVGADGKLRLWDVPTATRQQKGHTKPVAAVALSPNGLIAATGGGASLRLWKLADGADVWTIGHPSAVTSIAWKGDNAQVATGGADNVIRIWNVADGKMLAEYKGHTGAVTGMAWTPDNNGLVSGSADKSIKIWSLLPADKEKPDMQTVTGHAQGITSLALTGAGNVIVTGSSDGTVKLWNRADGKETRNIVHATPVSCVAASPDGKFIAVGGQDKLVKLYNPANGTVTATLAGHQAAVTSVSISRDNLRVIAGSSDGSVRAWDLMGQLLEFVVTKPATPNAVSFGIDDKTVIVGSSDNSVRVAKLAMQRVVSVSVGPVTCVAYAPNAASVLTGTMDKNVQLWSPTAGNQIRALTGVTAEVTGVAISADSTKIFAASVDKTVRAWNAADGNSIGSFVHPAIVRSVNPSPDGLRVVTGSDDNIVRVWHLASAKVLQSFTDHTKPVVGSAFDATGKIVMSVAQDGTLRQSPVSATHIIAAHDGGANCLTFNPTGTHIISGGADKLVKQFDLAGAQVKTFSGALAAIQCVAVRADNMQVAAGAAENFLHFWRLDNAQAMPPKIQLTVPVTSVAFSADNTQLAAGSADKHVRIFNTTDARLLEDILVADGVTSAAFTTDGTKLLLGGATNAAQLVSVSFLRLLVGHQGAVTAVEYSPDGNFLVSGGADKTVRKWALPAGTAAFSRAECQGPVTDVAVSSDSKFIVASSEDKTVRSWDFANGNPAKLITITVPIRGMHINTELGRVATVSDDNIVRVWDWESGKELQRFTGQTGLADVYLSADGQTVVSAGSDKTARIWPVSAGKLVVVPGNRINDLAMLPDGTGLLTAGADNVIRLWDMAGTKVRDFTGAPAAPSRLAVRPDSKQFTAGGDANATVKNFLVWNLAAAGAIKNIATPAVVAGLAFRADGAVAVSGTDKHIRVYSTETSQLLDDMASPAIVSDLVWAPDNKTLVAAGSDNNGYLFESNLKQVFTLAGLIKRVVYAPDGKSVIASHADNKLRQWSFADNKAVRTFSGNAGVINDVKLSPDGKSIITAGADKSVRVWDWPAANAAADVAAKATFMNVAAVHDIAVNHDATVIAAATADNQVHLIDAVTSQVRERFVGHTGTIHSVAMSGDGNLIVSASTDKTVRRWTATCQGILKAHTGQVNGLAMSVDGKQTYSTGADNTIIAWEDGKTVRKFAGSTGAVSAISLSPDGLLLAAVGADTFVRLWNTADGSPIAPVKAPVALTKVVAGNGKVVVAGADLIIRNYGVTQVDGKPVLELTHEAHGNTGAPVGLSLAADNRTLYSVSADQKLKRYYAADIGPRHELSEHIGPVYCVQVSNDNKVIAGGGADKTLRVWDAETGKLQHELNGHERPIYSVSIHPNGLQFASADAGGTIRQWAQEKKKEPEKKAEPAKKDDPKTEPKKPEPPVVKQFQALDEDVDGPVYSLVYSNDGNAIISGGSGRKWQGWNWGSEENKLVRSIEGHNHTIYAVTYNPAFGRIATLDYSGKLFIWTASNSAIAFHQQLPAASAYSMAYNPDGTEILIGTNDTRVIRIIVPPYAR